MSRAISTTLRAEVARRAENRCEYCRVPDSVGGSPFEVDHVLAIKHGGRNSLSNLAYACLRCNRCKGTDFATILEPDRAVFFFNPRKQVWSEHFESVAGQLHPKTAIGEATLKIFQFNFPIERVMVRQVLEAEGLYP